ncbi:Probable bifunctional chitinase/lysozyme precursor [Buttiauxella agrestis]|uniref:Probable bifunctional chitinase/lysozyme n=1 Tax=Buttiauxella agrestis TaxID=82977 RepID=A0A381KNH8_9ENTR|nr:chitinase [Buttiauxella agrestis]SUY92934.1 Probable bifunctional chitinase/lysozyme precursor [Buttiauxella agrestis]
MSNLYTPYIDVTINAEWSDWENHPQGRPNPIYYERALKWKVDGLVFGFLTLEESSKTPCWAASSAMPLDWAVPLAQELNSAGLRVIISFGGASNSDISTHFNATELEEIYVSTIELYGASGLDFDLENSLYDAAKICLALKNVAIRKPHVAISFTLPTLPTGLNQSGVDILKLAKKEGIEYGVNGMAMDYGDPYNNPDTATDMGKAAVDAALSISRQLAPIYPALNTAELLAKVAITPMIGLNDDGSMFKLDDINTLTRFAQINPLKFIGIWSFNRDNPSGYTYVDLETSSNPEQKVPGEYSELFISGLTAISKSNARPHSGRAYFQLHPGTKNRR